MIEQLIRRLAAAERDIERLRTIENRLTVLPVGPYLHIFPLAASGSPYYPYSSTLPRDGRLVQFVFSVYVAGTNDSSNYWTIALLYSPSSAVVASNQTGTSAAPSTWTRMSASVDVDVVIASVGFQVRAQSTGSPGDLYMGAPIIGMR